MDDFEYEGTCDYTTTVVDGVTVHTFAGSTAEAYNSTQVRDDIRDGDVLVVPSEGVVGFLLQAWPCAVTDAHGDLHTLTEAPAAFLSDSEDGPAYARSIAVARSLSS